MNEEEQQSNSSQSAPDDEKAKNFVNQPAYSLGFIICHFILCLCLFVIGLRLFYRFAILVGTKLE